MVFLFSAAAQAEFPFLAKVDSICSGAAPPSSLPEMAIPRVRSSRALKVRTVLGGCVVGWVVAGWLGDGWSQKKKVGFYTRTKPMKSDEIR